MGHDNIILVWHLLTWPAALVPGVMGAAVVVAQVLAQAPLQHVRPVSQRPFYVEIS